MADARGRPKEKKKEKDQDRDMAVEIPRCGFPAPSRDLAPYLPDPVRGDEGDTLMSAMDVKMGNIAERVEGDRCVSGGTGKWALPIWVGEQQIDRPGFTPFAANASHTWTREDGR